MQSEVKQNLQSSALPFSVLVEIFSYLNLRDRKTASLTCKLWRKVFQSPILWQTCIMGFCPTAVVVGGETNLIGGLFINKACIEVASRFGEYITDLSIDIYLPDTPDYDFIIVRWEEEVLEGLEKLRDFFNCIKNPKCLPHLRKVSFDGDWPYHYDPSSQQEAILAIVQFFRAQTKLTSCKFHIGFQSFEACLILDALTCHCLSTLQVLSVRLIFLPTYNREPKTMLRYISKYTNLSKLYIAYPDFGSDLLMALSKNNSTTLKVICICAHFHNAQTFHIIPTEIWKQVKLLIPELRIHIHLDVEEILCMEDLEAILPKEVPLEKLEIESANCCDTTFIHYFCENFTSTLVTLDLQETLFGSFEQIIQTSNNTDTNEAILSLLSICPKLEFFSYSGFVNLETVEKIIDFRVTNKIGTFCIFIGIVFSLSEMDNLKKLGEKYFPYISSGKLLLHTSQLFPDELDPSSDLNDEYSLLFVRWVYYP